MDRKKPRADSKNDGEPSGGPAPMPTACVDYRSSVCVESVSLTSECQYILCLRGRVRVEGSQGAYKMLIFARNWTSVLDLSWVFGRHSYCS